jgi:hypothetical protein
MNRKLGIINWSGVVLGWLVAVAGGIAISLILNGLNRLALEPTARGAGMGATPVVVSLVSGFLAYLLGGFTAGRISGRSGGLNGTLSAFLGLIVGVNLGLVLTRFGAVFALGVAVPPANFGFDAGDRVPALLVCLADVFGGYVGGELGEPSRPSFE